MCEIELFLCKHTRIKWTQSHPHTNAQIQYYSDIILKGDPIYLALFHDNVVLVLGFYL